MIASVAAMKPARAGHRLAALDLMRFVAAAMVLLFHYGFRGAIDGSFLHTVYPEIGTWSRYGYLGVELFFMISGFVILLTVDAGKGVPSHFAASRLSRLYPVFWVAATLTFVLMWRRPAPFGVGFGDYLLNLGMVPDLFGAEPVDGVYWTLQVELQFYVLVALYLLVLQTMVRIEWVLALWLLVLLCLAWIRTPYLIRMAAMAETGPFFIAGCLFYRIWRGGWTRLRAALLALTFGCALMAVHAGALAVGAKYHATLSPWIADGVITVCFAVFSVLCLRPDRFGFGGGLAIALGALTYPLYLVHQNIGYVLIDALSPAWGRWPALAVAIAAVLGLAWLLHRCVERPFNPRLRRSLEPRLRFLDFPRRHDPITRSATPGP